MTPMSPLGSIETLLDDLEASPTPYHATERAASILEDAGFRSCSFADGFPPADGNFFTRRGGLLVAWIQAEGQDGFTIVGTHTDSPNLRLKPKPERSAAGFAQLSVEIYGGVLLNSWLDRDLGLAGRVAVAGPEGGFEQRLINIDEPILRVPQLAIHLDREIRSDGLKLNPQTHLTPLWALSRGDGEQAFSTFVAERLDVDAANLLGFDLMAYDLQSPALVGRDRDLFASARIDNLVSTFCATRALAELAISPQQEPFTRCPVLVLYDHEEVGSESSSGAAGNALTSILERVAESAGQGRTAFLQWLARSVAISADGAHATHPNYVDKHDPDHQIALNQGIVIKRNANVRYASDAISEGFASAVCRQAGLETQVYSHRNGPSLWFDDRTDAFGPARGSHR